jgi:hypothetical protein
VQALRKNRIELLKVSLSFVKLMCQPYLGYKIASMKYRFLILKIGVELS